jgi:hypothetical protein
MAEGMQPNEGGQAPQGTPGTTTTQAGGEGQPQGQNIQVFLDERDLRSVYANSCRIHVTTDEVVLEFGFNMPNPNPHPQGGQVQQLYKVYDRVIMSYPNIKRLANSLMQLVRRYEQQFGDMGSGAQAGGPGGPRPVR